MEEKRQGQLIGLTEEEVILSRKKHGNNLLTPPKRTSLWRLYLEKFDDPVIRILLIAALLSLAISFVHWQFAESIGIFCAIFLATGVGFWFEMDANKKFDVLNKVNDETKVKVIRNGNACAIPKKDVVVGDIVLIEAGEEVPADSELIESVSLQVDESCLTGELLAEKSADPDRFDKEATYPSNCILKGTTVKDGHAICRVTAVGDETEFGKVAQKSSEISGEETPLNQQLDKLAKLIGVVGFALAILSFLARFIKDIAWHTVVYTPSQFYLLCVVLVSLIVAATKIWMPILLDAFELLGKKKTMPAFVENKRWFTWLCLGVLTFVVFSGIGLGFHINPISAQSWIDLNQAGLLLQYLMVSVALIVVAVPEGLPMSVTLSLALSMRKMLKTNNLVRKMHACETMGATTVICTDKTGTLTQNRMQVSDILFYGPDNEQKEGEGLSQSVKESIAVNTTAYLDFSDKDRINTLGNPTEGALLLWLLNQHVSYTPIRESFKIETQCTFSTERKYMATLGFSTVLQKKVLYVKGAPEIVLELCQEIGGAESKEAIHDQLAIFQSQAKRTLAFAYKIVAPDETVIADNKVITSQLTFL
ncbi:MAG: HAD-IC family P-type ATPase, partial [Bacteroidales bacterium]|nr:HAD-IC family P-type ATPase [Bacteroidales bacterium]